MLRTAFTFSFILSLAACCTSTPATDTSSTGHEPGSSASSSTGSAAGASSSGGVTGSANGSISGGSATGSATGSSTGFVTDSGSATGTTTGGGNGTTGGWKVVGGIPDLGGGNIFVSDIVPLPGPSNLPQVVFTESFGGVVGVFDTYWDGGYVTPKLIFDGGQGGFYHLQSANWHDGATNLTVSLDTNFNFVALAQVDGGTWTRLTANVSPVPAGGMSPVFDQENGQPWVAGLTETFHNGSNANLYRLDDAGVTVPFPNLGATSLSAAPCSKSDGGSLICVCYITGFSEQVLWLQTFDPASQTLGTPSALFDSQDAGFDGFNAGCAVTEVSPGHIVALASGLGPGMPNTIQQFAWASFALSDLGTLQAPNLYASDGGAPGSSPALWTWADNAFLLFRETGTFPEGMVGVALGGPGVPNLPSGAGVTNATSYPAGYANSANVNFLALPTTAQGGSLSVYSLSP